MERTLGISEHTVPFRFLDELQLITSRFLLFSFPFVFKASTISPTRRPEFIKIETFAEVLLFRAMLQTERRVGTLGEIRRVVSRPSASPKLTPSLS